MSRPVALVLLAAALCVAISCSRPAADTKTVVLYTSIDEPVAAPIIKAFEEKTKIKVRLVTDSEATKSVGLAERLRAEKDRPQADVWWGNEPFHTINLATEGVLTGYESPAAKSVNPKWRDDGNRWSSNGLRVRVLAFSPSPGTPGEGKGEGDFASLKSLLAPTLKDKIALARPTAGTTSGHIAALYALWGDEKTAVYLRDLKNNGVKLLGGNSVVADSVAKGTLFAGLTDNDDVESAKREGGTLSAVLPDQGDAGIGTLAIPTTVALVNGAPHRPAAEQLVDYLLSEEVEKKLLDANFTRYPVHGDPPQNVKFMDVNYETVARNMPQAIRSAMTILEGR